MRILVFFSSVLGLALMLSSCATSKSRVQNDKSPRVYCHYTAVSRVKRSAIPSEVYVFPPQLADSRGKPIEALKPMTDASGALKDWASPSSRSREIQNSVRQVLTARGYQVVDFQRVLEMKQPHSILILSLFYTKPAGLQNPKEGKPDMSQLTMVRAKTFDVDLNPSKGRAISNLDGATYFHASDNRKDLEEKSFKILLGWMGDDVSGFINIESPSS